jgi:EmrB/QacA subfamily drug resistance transporter
MTVRMGTPQGRWVLLATVLGSGVAMLDATVVNIALNHIGADLHAGFAGLQWTVNAYTLTLAALILLGGSLGDRFGRRRVFVIGVIWFALASLLCGLAPSIEVLIVARAVQGVGGALLTPGSLALISASFSGNERAAAVGAWSGLAGIAGAVGPFLGGWLVQWTWRAVFLINLPLALIVVVVAARHVPESRDPDAPPRTDVVGAALAALGLGMITAALTQPGPTTLLVGILGVASLVGFVLVERRSAHPLAPLDIFASRRFNAANLVTLLVYAALGVVFLLLVLQLQVVAGFSPLLAGAALLPVTLIMLALSSSAGRLAQRIGPRLPMTCGPLISAVGLSLLLRVGPGARYLTDVLPAVIVFGLGLSLTVAPLTATVLDSVADRHAGLASGINNAVARAAGLLAVAVIPVVAGISNGNYTNPADYNHGFHRAMMIAAGLLVLGAVLAFVSIPRPQPHPPTHHLHLETCPQCGVTGPAVHPAHTTEDSPVGSQ